jgi:hypothetical protein
MISFDRWSIKWNTKFRIYDLYYYELNEKIIILKEIMLFRETQNKLTKKVQYF